MINEHYIDREKCIQCGTCAEVCPVGAVDHERYRIDRDKCLVCLGCLNNCPAEAMSMEYLSRPVVGWKRFCADNGIVIAEPKELKS